MRREQQALAPGSARAKEAGGVKADRSGTRRAGVPTVAQLTSNELLLLQRTTGNRVTASLVLQRQAIGKEELTSVLTTIDVVLDPESVVAAIGEPEGSWSVQTIQRAVQRQKSDEPRVGSVADVIKAVAATKQFKKTTETLKKKAKKRVKSDWKKLQLGGKAAVIGSGFLIAGGSLTGALLHPESRAFILENVAGQKFPIPYVDGLSVKFNIDGKGQVQGGMLYFNVATVLPSSLGFK